VGARQSGHLVLLSEFFSWSGFQVLSIQNCTEVKETVPTWCLWKLGISCSAASYSK